MIKKSSFRNINYNKCTGSTTLLNIEEQRQLRRANEFLFVDNRGHAWKQALYTSNENC